MNCLTCNDPLKPTLVGLPNKRRKYCSAYCRPYGTPKFERPTSCKHCQKSITQNTKAGQPRRYCDRTCASRARQELLKAKRQRQLICVECNKSFKAAGAARKFCSKECRLENAKRHKAEQVKQYFANLYPDGIKTKVCRWCSQPMEVSARKSYAGRLYHPDCSKEAERARYRIKTVRRQTKLNPNRISADQVVREYGDVCHICQDQIDMSLPRTSKMGLTIDHLIALSKGGTDTMENLRPAHWICNRRKSDKPLEEVIA